MKEKKNFYHKFKAGMTVPPSKVQKDGKTSSKFIKFEDHYVIPLYRYYTLKEKQSNFCLFTRRGIKSLHQIISTEQIAGRDDSIILSIGKDLGEGLKHSHKKGYLHVGMKTKNIVRTSDGDIKIIDCDSSVELGKKLSGKGLNTAFICLEVLRHENYSNESAEKLETELKQDRLNLKQIEDTEHVPEKNILFL